MNNFVKTEKYIKDPKLIFCLTLDLAGSFDLWHVLLKMMPIKNQIAMAHPLVGNVRHLAVALEHRLGKVGLINVHQFKPVPIYLNNYKFS